jgi:class 3 adenylate cyclase
VLFTDIVGSTEHLSAIGDADWRDLLDQHDTLARRAIERTGGHYVSTTGDGLLATFEGPASAVRCAQEIGAAIRPLGLEIPSGVHTGELELVGSEVRGIAVHIGARVMSLAGPSEVMVSSTVRTSRRAAAWCSRTRASTS